MTAEEFLKSKEVVWETDRGTSVVNDFDCCKMMIEFAKLHVEAALKAASENAEINHWNHSNDNEYDEINKYSILDAYPLENIK